MDADTQVEEVIESGQKLVGLLRDSGIHVAAACWIKTIEESSWVLYIATGEVDEIGLAAAYRKVFRLLRAIPGSWITTSDVKLVGLDNPVARELTELQKRFPGRLPTRSRSLRIASIGTDEIYLYPLPAQQEVPLIHVPVVTD